MVSIIQSGWPLFYLQLVCILILPGDCFINGGFYPVFDPDDNDLGILSVLLVFWGATMMRLELEPDLSLRILRAGLPPVMPGLPPFTPVVNDASDALFILVSLCSSMLFYFDLFELYINNYLKINKFM